MIIVEHLIINNEDFTRTYSDEFRYVVREGAQYTEAYDPARFGRTYTEGDLIPEEELTPEQIQEREIEELVQEKFDEANRALLEAEIIEFPEEEEPDYLNEHEQEPNYFE